MNCCQDKYEVVSNFEAMSEQDKDEHLYSLFRRIEGHKSDEYMRKWLGFFMIVHRQAILAKVGWYLKLKK